MARGAKTTPRRVDQKNRVTLPEEVLSALGLQPGDFVQVEVSGEKAIVRKVRFVAD